MGQLLLNIMYTKPSFLKFATNFKPAELLTFIFMDKLTLTFLLHSGPTAQKQGSNKKKQTTIIVVSASLGSVLVCVILAVYVAWRKIKRSRKLILGPAPACDDTIEVVKSGSRKNKVILLGILTSIVLVQVGLTLIVYAYKKKCSRRPCKLMQALGALGEDYPDGSQNIDVDLPSFSVAKIAKYTNHFSESNKHGKCGFGTVYKVNHLYMPILCPKALKAIKHYGGMCLDSFFAKQGFKIYVVGRHGFCATECGNTRIIAQRFVTWSMYEFEMAIVLTHLDHILTIGCSSCSFWVTQFDNI
ncbi:EGF-like domain-containing protein [Artemisia annua]|uniref:EGF-like domain-containing protein n=1 Tax=Artemisia annua TaxID=35608 RepID=A0A2U1L409_ARTAN|nr:EGF-like domain-containing protein [Artemisia annua]